MAKFQKGYYLPYPDLHAYEVVEITDVVDKGDEGKFVFFRIINYITNVCNDGLRSIKVNSNEAGNEFFSLAFSNIGGIYVDSMTHIVDYSSFVSQKKEELRLKKEAKREKEEKQYQEFLQELTEIGITTVQFKKVVELLGILPDDIISIPEHILKILEII